MKFSFHNSLRALFLSLAVFLSLPMLAEQVEIDGITYDLVAKVKQATVIAKSSGEYSDEVVIPESVEYGGTAYSVTSIGEWAFYRCSGLTSVTIGNSVTSIGEDAFSYCYGLTSVTIGNSVTSIGRYAFYRCYGLTSVTIPNSVTSIGKYAFERCSGLTSVIIPNSVKSIEEGAFFGCSGLTSVTIPNSVTNIEWEAFRDCSKLSDVYCYAEEVPSTESNTFEGSPIGTATLHVPAVSVESYTTTEPWSSFKNIVAITTEVDGINYDFDADTKQATVIAKSGGKYSGEVIIPESVVYEGTEYSVTSIGEDAFYSCSGLTSVSIPNSVTSIGRFAFFYCPGLTSVTIPNSVESIGNFAFKNCSGLTSVTIGNGVESIGNAAFEYCSGLTSVHISDIAAWCNIDFDDYESNPLYYAEHLYLNGEEVKDLVIPNSVTSIGNYAFRRCSGLTSVTIPNSVTSIGDFAFYGCSGLTSVTIPNSVMSIGDYAFWGCSGLTSVIIPNSVKSIEEGAFFGCSGLTSVTIPNSVTNIGGEAFRGCSGLTSVSIPNSVTSIGGWAFWGCSSLTSVAIGSGVTSIGVEAFRDCSKLHDVYCYAEEVPTTEGNTFEGSPIGTATLHVPAGSVDNYKTAPWSGFRTIVAISTEVDGINYDFDADTKQATVIAKSSGKYSGEVVIPESVEYGGTAYSVTSIGESAFEDCSGLTSVTIPNSVKSIGSSAFRDCFGLTSVTIPNSVTSIGSYAFEHCSGLTSVTIPNSVTSIGEGAFYACI